MARYTVTPSEAYRASTGLTVASSSGWAKMARIVLEERSWGEFSGEVQRNSISVIKKIIMIEVSLLVFRFIKNELRAFEVMGKVMED
jgi:hypothetical protein